MKRALAALLCGLVLAAFALGAAGCGESGFGGGKKALQAGSPSFEVKSVAQGYDAQYASIDVYGNVVLQSAAQDGSASSYMLYNVVDGSSVTAETSIQDTSLSGLYCTLEYTAAEGAGFGTQTYNFYAKNGKVHSVTVSAVDGLDMSLSGNTLQLEGGTYLYLDADGNGHVGQAGFGYDNGVKNSPYTFVLDDYVLDFSDAEGVAVVYGRDGSFVRTVDLHEEIGFNRDMQEIFQFGRAQTWSFGNVFWVQFALPTPVDGAFTFTDEEGTAYDLQTYKYDAAADKVSEVSVPFFISRVEKSANGTYAVIYGNEVLKDKTVGPYIVQTIGEDGKNYADLQELLPGANTLYFAGGNIVLDNGVQQRVLDGSGGEICTQESDFAYIGNNYFVNFEKRQAYDAQGKEVFADTMQCLDLVVETGLVYAEDDNRESSTYRQVFRFTAATNSLDNIGTLEDPNAHDGNTGIYWTMRNAEGELFLYNATYGAEVARGSSFSVRECEIDGVRYALIRAVDADGNASLYVCKLTPPLA